MESYKNLQLRKSQACKIVAAVLLSLFCFSVRAQQKLYGNISIPSGAQLTLFGNQTFAGGSGVSSAIVRVGRAIPVGLLNFPQNTQITGAGTGGFIDGYVRKFGSALFVFPVGHNGFYGPFAAAADKTYGAYYHANPSAASFPTSSKDLSVAAVSGTEYWDINGLNPTKITLTWNADSNISSFANPIGNLIIVGWKNGKWEKIPSKIDAISVLGGSSTTLGGSITTANSLPPNNYEVYSLGADGAPLPVTLTRFVAKSENNIAILDWTTTFEANSDFFEIERSQNGKSWQSIGILTSFKESVVLWNYQFIDQKPLAGENLYRLKMVDTDESFAYSSIQSVIFNMLSNENFIYPNPATTVLNFQQNVTLTNKPKIRVTDSNGRDRTCSVVWIENSINIQSLENGSYIISVFDEKGDEKHSKILVLK
ncbi:T9SS type A sorting domain-containing protein [Dyadobacter luticola]|uniref:T9SS type A sorting domain-containing protein n=1 Tax=Dyadobacter luticola TaxID=1979387 RepID=A0A5R9L102_9BACT|nr:T9SS type A sorting domain-containing protein [Dyadobacter luticola]TLV02226.1 T9SS type A sorting domain-containing protein [Dyadobacter luticola]